MVFVDDDCEIKKNHFIKYNKAWKKYNYARAIGGRISIKKESGNFSKKEKALLNKHGWCYGSLDYKKTLKLKYGQLLFGSNMSIKLGKNIKNYLFDKNLGREIYNNQVLYAEDYEICNRFILNGEIVVFDKNISINNIVTTNRFSEKYLFNRYWKLGIERYISDKLLEKIGGRTYKNELFNAISIKNIILGRSGILQIFKTKYDFLTLLSYFSSGKSFIK